MSIKDLVLQKLLEGDDCVSKKISKIHGEQGETWNPKSQPQAIAIAKSVCSELAETLNELLNTTVKYPRHVSPQEFKRRIQAVKDSLQLLPPMLKGLKQAQIAAAMKWTNSMTRTSHNNQDFLTTDIASVMRDIKQLVNQTTKLEKMAKKLDNDFSKNKEGLGENTMGIKDTVFKEELREHGELGNLFEELKNQPPKLNPKITMMIKKFYNSLRDIKSSNAKMADLKYWSVEKVMGTVAGFYWEKGDEFPSKNDFDEFVSLYIKKGGKKKSKDFKDGLLFGKKLAKKSGFNEKDFLVNPEKLFDSLEEGSGSQVFISKDSLSDTIFSWVTRPEVEKYVDAKKAKSWVQALTRGVAGSLKFRKLKYWTGSEGFDSSKVREAVEDTFNYEQFFKKMSLSPKDKKFLSSSFLKLLLSQHKSKQESIEESLEGVLEEGNFSGQGFSDLKKELAWALQVLKNSKTTREGLGRILKVIGDDKGIAKKLSSKIALEKALGLKPGEYAGDQKSVMIGEAKIKEGKIMKEYTYFGEGVEVSSEDKKRKKIAFSIASEIQKNIYPKLKSGYRTLDKMKYNFEEEADRDLADMFTNVMHQILEDLDNISYKLEKHFKK